MKKITKERIAWIDVAKTIGMFAIILGHFKENAGHAYKFVYMFHIALFFFLSGCTYNFKKMKILEYIKDKIKKLLIPFIFFSVIFIIVKIIMTNGDISVLKSNLLNLSMGILKGTGYGGLWFISCLFCQSIIFKLIDSLIKNKYIILVICFTISAVSWIFINNSIIFNLDKALQYIFIYSLGWISFNSINKLFDNDYKYSKFIVPSLFIVLSIFATLCFFDKDFIFSFISNEYLNILYDKIFRPLVLIMFILIFSHLISHIKIFGSYGKISLYLCCSEGITKNLLSSFSKLLGINLEFTNNFLGVYIYTGIIMFIIYTFLYSYEKQLLNKIYKILKLD